MILTKEEIQAITLNAKFVHKYADQAFFASEINEAPRRLGDQAHLNFFVRYHHRDAPERYSWSRVRRVVMLEDVMAAAKAKNTSSSNSGGMATAATTTASSSSSSSTAAVTSATVEWKGKTFWVGFMVESVKTAATAASAHSNETGGSDSTNQAGEAEASQNDPTPKKEAHLHHDDGEEEEVFVALTQLSNTVPEDAEVLAFCVASAARRAGERYEDAESAEAAPVLDVMPLYEMSPEATQAEPVLDAEGNVIESDTAVLATDESDAAAAAATLAALPDARAYVPTARQAELLKAYKKQHFAQHQWSPEEIEASKQLRLKYSSIGVAAAPVRTVAYVHEHRVVERRQRVSTASPVGQLLVGAAELTQDPLSEMSTQADTQNSQQQLQQPQIAVPLSPSAASAVSDTPLSPFLPRSVLRQQQALHGSLNHTVFAGRASPSNASLSLSSSQVGASQPPSPLTPHDTSSALSQHLSQLRAAEDAFYKYVSDEQRSYQLNRLASITLRNSETNAYNRRRGIANERRLERRGNLLESRGLWITDDKERAKQAEVYIKETSTSTSDAKKKPDKAPAAATAAAAAAGGGGGGGGTGGEKTDATTSAEEAFVERFRAYHKAQNISFASFEDDSLLSSADADTESMVQAAAAAAAAALAESKAEGTGDEKEGSGAGGGARTGRRAVRRLLPNRLNTEEATPLSVQAQLVHRSTVRMAKRARDE